MCDVVWFSMVWQCGVVYHGVAVCCGLVWCGGVVFCVVGCGIVWGCCYWVLFEL